MPVDPCGMVMDMLNTGYKSKMFPYIDRPDIYALVEWYPARPDAKVYEAETCFRSSIWGSHLDQPPGPGELYERPWKTVPAKVLLSALGRSVCGTPEEFDEGVIYDPDWVPPPVNGEGIPLCCNPAQLMSGGAAASGTKLGGCLVQTGADTGSGGATVGASFYSTEEVIAAGPVAISRMEWIARIFVPSTLQSVDWSFGTAKYGSDLGSGTATSLTQAFLYVDAFGFHVYKVTMPVSVSLPSGTSYVTLRNAVVVGTPHTVLWGNAFGTLQSWSQPGDVLGGPLYYCLE